MSHLPLEFTFKDGLGATCKGAPFTALKHWSPNARNGSAWNASNDVEAVRIDTDAETSFDPAELVISAKFQCGWYQYVQRWTFNSYGEIPCGPWHGRDTASGESDKAHVHHMYFRVDLDIDGWSTESSRCFRTRDSTTRSTETNGRWKSRRANTYSTQRSQRNSNPRSCQRVQPGLPQRGYEFKIPAQAGRNTHSTADIWATVYRGDTVERGPK